MIRGAKPGDRVMVWRNGSITTFGQTWNHGKDSGEPNTGTVVEVNRGGRGVMVTVEPDHLPGGRFRFRPRALVRISED